MMRFARSRPGRAAAFCGAAITFAYIVLVARTHTPWPVSTWPVGAF
tara:strand:- start:67 stop:204 length:138 start_codon:yes stop_codon:yes gene_type:complete